MWQKYRDRKLRRRRMRSRVGNIFWSIVMACLVGVVLVFALRHMSSCARMVDQEVKETQKIE